MAHRDAASSESISVVVAAKNAERTISLCVKSALIGLGKNDEVLVFLDGCADGTGDIVRAIADTRLRVFESESGLGRSEARNYLIGQASNNLISILDADDVALPWRFVVSRKLLRKYDFVFGSAILFGNLPFGLRAAISYPVKLSPALSRHVLASRNPFIHSTASFRKHSLGSDEPYGEFIAEEYVLWVKMANQGRTFYRSRIPMSCYKIHPTQISAQENYQSKVEDCAVLRQEKARLRRQVAIPIRRRTVGLWIEEELLELFRRLVRGNRQ